MERTIVQLYLNVNNRISGQYPSLHSALDTCVNSWDVFLRNRTADNAVDELVALTGLVRGNSDLNVTVLTFTTGLTSVFHINISRFSDGFFVSYLWLTYVCLYLELTQQTVNDDLQMELTHAGDDGLAGFFVCVGLEGRVFLCQFCQSNTHLFLTCFSLRLDSNTDNRLWEFHRLQDDRSFWITQGITGGYLLNTYRSSDITCVASIDIFSVVCVHLKDDRFFRYDLWLR